MASWWRTRRLFSTASRMQTLYRDPYTATNTSFVFPIRTPERTSATPPTLIPEQKALKDKENGSWKDLTIEEKKELYRMTFPRTVVEQRIPRGEGKWVWGSIGCFLSLSFFLVFLQKLFLSPKPGHQIIKEWNDLYLLVRDPPAKLDKKMW